MRVEECPGLKICQSALPEIAWAYDKETILRTGGESLRDGGEALLQNAQKLNDRGINVSGLFGRCNECPVGKYILDEGRPFNFPPPKP